MLFVEAISDKIFSNTHFIITYRIIQHDNEKFCFHFNIYYEMRVTGK